MPDYLNKRNGRWQFVRRVPLEYAKLDQRGVIKHSTKVPVASDRRGIKAGEIADAMNRDLEAYWRGLSEGKPEAQNRYNDSRRHARTIGRPDYTATSELGSRSTVDVLERLGKLENQMTRLLMMLEKLLTTPKK